MRRAFTLLELMVVVGIMAFLGLASANGYNALKRGMAERGAVDAVSAFLRTAKERALVDRVPTAVFFWNRCVREATADDNAIVVGEAVAVRRAGRITYIDSGGKYLYDEYGDLDRSFDTGEELEKRKGFRLWRMSDNGNVSDMEYSIVSDGVFANDGKELVHLTGVSSVMSDGLEDWEKKILYGDGADEDGTIIPACAFCKLDGGTFSGWKVGTAYGLEFLRITLPNGFLFGDTVPTSVGDVKKVSPASFNPNSSSGSVNDETVHISYYPTGADGNPDTAHRRDVGVASSKEK